jgi:peptidoglycan/LPS O-acetylase OafA/YrhL
LQRSELSPAQATYLDFLRALGALMVLFGHAAEYFLPTSFLANGVAQTLGVYIFFLISGFLISLSVLQKLYSPTRLPTDSAIISATASSGSMRRSSPPFSSSSSSTR